MSLINNKPIKSFHRRITLKRNVIVTNYFPKCQAGHEFKGRKIELACLPFYKYLNFELLVDTGNWQFFFSSFLLVCCYCSGSNFRLNQNQAQDICLIEKIKITQKGAEYSIVAQITSNKVLQVPVKFLEIILR